MLQLSRTVRFSVDDHGRDALSQPRTNTFASWPTMTGLGRYYEIEVCCRGEPDPVTGYFLNIKAIDQAVREVVLPEIQSRIIEERNTDWPFEMLGRMFELLATALEVPVERLTWRITPYLSIETERSAMTKCTLRQQYSFAASHRLHCPCLSDAENERVFGKCNNPNGHGHNYRVEVAVSVDASEARANEPRAFSLVELEETVRREVIDRFDHKNLNEDCAEFAELNPSVENISRVCYELLDKPLRRLKAPLHSITVWETEKTACTYPG